MNFPRSSGILLHVTSLPGAHGIGDLGEVAHEFVEFLSGAGQKIWQVLPLSPTGYGDSPYQCFSAFAGNPLFIDLVTLRERGLLSAQDLASAPSLSEEQVEYDHVIDFKQALLHKAASVFLADNSQPDRAAFDSFCRTNSDWLDDYALFMSCKRVYKDVAWVHWDPEIRDRNSAVLQEWQSKLSSETQSHKFAQFEFFRQWERLRSHCGSRGISIMGDIPIYVAHDSADVWAHRELFRLDEQGRPAAVAGVPPDYFSATGQLWGNPLYQWDVSAKSGHQWWTDRVRASLKLFDLVRLDHFRGFEAFWEVPANASTADAGRWVKGPGVEFFQTQGPSFRPHNYSRELVAYTGGHDNDTTVGWWTSSGIGESTRSADDIRKEHDFTRAYLGFQNEPVHWVFIRAVLASVANIAIIPLQDALGLGSEARMNLPGTISGNWKWRYKSNVLTKQLTEQLRSLTTLFDR